MEREPVSFDEWMLSATPERMVEALEGCSSTFMRESVASSFTAHAREFDERLIHHLVEIRPGGAADLVRNPYLRGRQVPQVLAALAPSLRQSPEARGALLHILFIAIRRRVLRLDEPLLAWLEREVEHRKGSSGAYDRLASEWLGRVRRAREEGIGSAKRLSESLMPAYRDFEMHFEEEEESVALEDRIDPGAHYLIHSPHCTSRQVLSLFRDWDNAGLAAAVGDACWIGHREYVQHPGIRRRLRPYLVLPGVAHALACAPDPRDFRESFALAFQHRREGVLDIARDARISSSALAWAGPEMLVRLMQDEDGEVRSRAIRAWGAIASPPPAPTPRTRRP